MGLGPGLPVQILHHFYILKVPKTCEADAEGYV